MTKKLYRSQTDRMIAGICGGLASYTDTDATLWRIGFVTLAFLSGGALIFAYLLCIFIIPSESEVQPPKDTKRK